MIPVALQLAKGRPVARTSWGAFGLGWVAIQTAEAGTDLIFNAELAVEEDVGTDLSLATERVFTVELATEVDTAFDVTFAAGEGAGTGGINPLALQLAKGRAFAHTSWGAFGPGWVVTGFAVEEAGGELDFNVEEATETDVGSDVALTVELVLNLEQAVEADVAVEVELSATPDEVFFDAEEAVEVDVAVDVELSVVRVFAVEEAVEVDLAFDLNLETENDFLPTSGSGWGIPIGIP